MDTLMRLHQMAFQGTGHPGHGPGGAGTHACAKRQPLPQPSTPRLDARQPTTNPGSPRPRPKSRGFMESFGASGQALEAPDTAPRPPATHLDMAVGTWVDLRVDGHWGTHPAHLGGPHGTLFLFTSASGRSQSMTRRLRDRLMAQGALRVVSSTPWWAKRWTPWPAPPCATAWIRGMKGTPWRAHCLGREGDALARGALANVSPLDASQVEYSPCAPLRNARTKMPEGRGF